MKFTELELKGVYLISPKIFSDSRGQFHRSFCKDEFKENGLDDSFEQGILVPIRYNNGNNRYNWYNYYW